MKIAVVYFIQLPTLVEGDPSMLRSTDALPDMCSMQIYQKSCRTRNTACQKIKYCVIVAPKLLIFCI